MVALLSASSSSGSAAAFTFTLACRECMLRETLDATGNAICMPEIMIDEYRAEIAGRVGDTPIPESFSDVNRNVHLSESWHSVQCIG